MTHRKDAEPDLRMTRESEIFRDPPGSGNYSSSIGAAQGIELFQRQWPCAPPRPAQEVFSKSARQFRSSPKLTCWWSAAAQPERAAAIVRPVSARTCCWSSATTTWAGFGPAVLHLDRPE